MKQEILFGRSTKWFHPETQNWPISQLCNLLKDHPFGDERVGLELNPPYQRGLVWDEEHKVALIDSIVTGLGIPAIYLRMRNDYVYEAIDGKQRINAICGFMNGAFKFNGKLFSEHTRDSQQSFKNSAIGVTLLRFISQEEALEIYERINFNGVPHE